MKLITPILVNAIKLLSIFYWVALKHPIVFFADVCVHTNIPPARQRYIEKLLLIIYFVFLCDKAKKSRFFGQV
jgi:hypothetical protein